MCTVVLIAEIPHLGSYTRALLVSQDRRHHFVTPFMLSSSLGVEVQRQCNYLFYFKKAALVLFANYVEDRPFLIVPLSLVHLLLFSCWCLQVRICRGFVTAGCCNGYVLLILLFVSGSIAWFIEVQAFSPSYN
jgi:hypothetical protein